eukprot:11804312-Alexandrium_andersonii.AAC.1
MTLVRGAGTVRSAQKTAALEGAASNAVRVAPHAPSTLRQCRPASCTTPGGITWPDTRLPRSWSNLQSSNPVERPLR